MSGLGERPEFIMKVPRLWSPSLVERERTIERFLNCLATLGRCSVMETPLAAVGLGLCSPPVFLDSGFMSQMSMVGGPPAIHRMMRLLFFFLRSAAQERR